MTSVALRSTAALLSSGMNPSPLVYNEIPESHRFRTLHPSEPHRYQLLLNFSVYAGLRCYRWALFNVIAMEWWAPSPDGARVNLLGN